MNYRKLIIILFLLAIPSGLFAKSGPSIPTPKLSITEAISVANKYFYNKETRLKDSDSFKKSEYIIISAEYANYFKETRQKEWAWKITFIHPVQTDHSVVYKVTDDKQVIFLYASE